MLDRVINYFMPAKILADKTHSRYDEFRVLVSSAVLSIPLLILFPLFLRYLDKPFLGYYITLLLIIVMLYSIKWLVHYRIPMSLLAAATYYILYGFIKDTGFIYSTHMGVLHIYLLAAIWVDKKWGWYVIITNVVLFAFIYQQTLHAGVATQVSPVLGSPLYALILHSFVSVFLGSFLAWEQFDQEKNRRKIRALQDEKITALDEAVQQRTEQLNSMRQVMAADFHDETGNMLSAITRQASILRLKLQSGDPMLPIVDSITSNSDELYARSKDFLWNLHHNSDDPEELFQYMTAHGQAFYNQFDIAFSSASTGDGLPSGRLDTFASLNIIFIFKEAMTNVVKHAGASEVVLEMKYDKTSVMYSLHDNGQWKTEGSQHPHYGLNNIRRRCSKHQFDFSLEHTAGTHLQITVPLSKV